MFVYLGYIFNISHSVLFVTISGVFFISKNFETLYNKTNINRLFKSDIFLERRKFQQFFSTKIVLLI
jgi:hypothetical protein